MRMIEQVTPDDWHSQQAVVVKNMAKRTQSVVVLDELVDTVAQILSE